jgi:hypothetical protein
VRSWLVLLAATGLLAGTATPARMHDPEKLPTTRIRDLHYGDVLFYLYQGEDFEAVTRLLAYQQWKRIPHHEPDGELLLGGLYLSLGLHNEAGKRFESLLTNDVPTGVRNRAWFYLAQVWYERGYLDRAETALRRINGRMSSELEAQKEHLFANVLMHEGHFDEAIGLLARARGAEGWYAYARFNLGVALVRQNRLADADAFLTTVGSMPATSNEMLALKDRANLALGYAYLQASKPAEALTAFERVRLNGPFSNKALLGTGYADLTLGQYDRALTPWLTLRDRNVLDPAVQESYLAVPFAYAKLNASSQSAQYYQSALETFSAENGRLDAAVVRVQDGELLDRALHADRENIRHDWFWQLKSVPNAPESRYLYAVLAGYDFQAGLRTYRDMLFMSDTLAQWSDSMEAFQDMIDTRERAYGERVPVADSLLASGAVEKLQQHRIELQSRLDAIEHDQDAAALGSKEEREQWSRVLHDEAALAGLPGGEDKDQAADKLRLVKGVLVFKLNESFKARLWQQQRVIKDLDLALHEAQGRWIRVERARKSVPADTGEMAERVAALKQRIATLQVRLASTQEKQKAYLAQLAVDELQQQKDRVAAYQVQARFALANMYDRASGGGQPEAEQGSPAPDEPAPAADPRTPEPDR